MDQGLQREETIRWRHSLDEARREARAEGKPVLIDLFSPT
jgi:hypothetical protein